MVFALLNCQSCPVQHLHALRHGSRASQVVSYTRCCVHLTLWYHCMQMLKGPRNHYYILAHGMLEALAGRVLVGPAPPRTDDARVADAEAAVRRLLTKERLNESQRQAVLSTLFPQAPMQIVHGPPGTGEHECRCMTGASFVRRSPRCLL